MSPFVSGAVLIQFSDGSIGVVERAEYADGYYIWGVRNTMGSSRSSSPSCYYESTDCSGDCLILGNSLSLIPGSIFNIGPNYHVYTGNEELMRLTPGSYRRTGPDDQVGDDLTGAPIFSACSTMSSGEISLVKPSKTWSLPPGVTLPIQRIGFK